MREPAPMDAVDRTIIDGLQGGFPICERPWAVVAERLAIDEGELIGRVRRLLERRVLTRFGPMFQVERIGGAFVLAALRVPEADWERVLAVVNGLPEVAHNYRREGGPGSDLNMWFVLATETGEEIPPLIAQIERSTGLEVFAFPKLREYFVEMKLPVRG